MRAISLLFHDVVSHEGYDASGFTGVIAARYKLEREAFNQHIKALARAIGAKPVNVLDVQETSGGSLPLILTCDDGGSSAMYVADVLEGYGWRGHFFITTNFVGRPAFVNKDQVRALKKRGHFIGSHSCSHPERMSYLNWKALVAEWTDSLNMLSDVLGEQVNLASVPGGYYSTRVGEAASYSGIKALFTSEPITKCRTVQGCLVFGRYTLWGGMGPEVSVGYASGHVAPRLRQWAFWNSKKCAKFLAGQYYSKVTPYLLKRAAH